MVAAERVDPVIRSSRYCVGTCVLISFFFAFCLYSCSGRFIGVLQLCAVKTQKIEADFDCLENLSGVSFGGFPRRVRIIVYSIYWCIFVRA